MEIPFQTSKEERQRLESICQKSRRTQTDVLREMLRGLKYATTAHTEAPEAELTPPPLARQQPPDASS